MGQKRPKYTEIHQTVFIKWILRKKSKRIHYYIKLKMVSISKTKRVQLSKYKKPKIIPNVPILNMYLVSSTMNTV